MCIYHLPSPSQKEPFGSLAERKFHSTPVSLGLGNSPPPPPPSTAKMLLPIISTLTLAGFASAAIHNLFVGNLGNPALMYSLEFNDETHSLTRIETITADASHAWLTFDHNKQNIYGASLGKSRIASYKVASPTTVKLTHAVEASGACHNTTSAFVEAQTWPPYTVYSVSWPGPNACGMAIGVDPASGALTEVKQSWKFASASGVHGLALGRRGGSNDTYIYSADLSGDAVWTHRADAETGKVTQVGKKVMPREKMHPRHIRVHPNGTYVYVLMEAANSLVSWSLDAETGAASVAGKEYSLIPKGADTAKYWSAEVMLSPSGRYLWATARAQRGTAIVGYISVYLLAADGAIVKRMMQVPTTTTGGWANAITPAFWSDEYAALADTPKGYVEVWKLSDPTTTADGVEYATLKAVAHVGLQAEEASGCCANAIWYS
ncbi:Lactonase, 7-bladed beta-propeller-domain-containing protein [Podospora didyma]|uniref:Lactonase, 7-bladed beta-propeller-domain-containing protein n=1 Tax=Podospora didyma TaxID=330526 RepID=A0AAE0K1N5_9PEZI|nr:Lactonase, 7-bladed beta-propeller-domain-containing protein [Podospora didyma]